MVAYFSGVLTADADGVIRTSFDMPAFNGTVRLSAVVWSKTGVGQASQDVLVRDPVVVTPIRGNKKVRVSLKDILAGVMARGHELPLLIRIENILESQISYNFV